MSWSRIGKPNTARSPPSNSTRSRRRCALDGNKREAWTALKRLVARGEVPTIPTPVTAQAWRDGRRQARLARALGDCRSEPLGDDLARRARELCGRAGTADIVAAAVIESAGPRGDDVYTSDFDDLMHLTGHVPYTIAIVPITA